MPESTGPADIVFRDGPIFTGEGWAGALAIRGERIAAVAPAPARDWIGPRTRVVSLAGRAALPGFHDAHTHLLGGALARESLVLDQVRSRAELREALRGWIAARGPEAWVSGRGWDADRFADGALPTRHDLDPVSPRTPVLLRRRDGHAALANGRALALAGIGPDTPDPPGGRIVRDAQGEATGLLLEDPAIDLVGARVPRPDLATRARAAEAVLREAASLGITCVQDDPSYDAGLEADAVYAGLWERGALPIRVELWRNIAREPEDLRAQEAALTARGVPADRLRFGLLKGYLDGSLGSRTALLHEPYADDPAAGCGVDLDATRELGAQVARAHRAGYQVGLHAIGDLAATRALELFAAAESPDAPRSLRAARHRLEHAQLVRPADIPRLVELAVVASVQPIHLASDLRIAPLRLGPARCAAGAYPWASFRDAGALLAFGTDFPIEPLDPLPGIACALTRRSPREPDLPPFAPHEALGLEEALQAYGLGAARAAHREHELGRLAPGALADLCVLSGDPRRVPPGELTNLRCELTLCGGQVVFEAEG